LFLASGFCPKETLNKSSMICQRPQSGQRFPLCSQNQWLAAIDFGGAFLRRKES